AGASPAAAKVAAGRVPANLPRGTRSADRADGEPVALDETPVVRALRKLGARIVFIDGDKGGPVSAVDLRWTRTRDTDLKQLAALKHLQDLYLRETKVT